MERDKYASIIHDELNKVARYKINAQKSETFLYTNNK